MLCGRGIQVFFLGISHIVRGKVSKAGASVRLKLGSGGAAAPRGT